MPERANARAEPGNRIRHPTRSDARASGTMNQTMFEFYGHSTETEFTMAVGEQPPQRLENFGVKAVSDTELLGMILQGNGIRSEQAIQIASRLIAEAGSIAGLVAWDALDYQQTKGIGRIKGLQLAAVAEIARRMMAGPRASAPMLNRADLVAAYLAPSVAGLQIEKFWVLCLNRKNRLIKQVEISLAPPQRLWRTHGRFSERQFASVPRPSFAPIIIPAVIPLRVRPIFSSHANFGRQPRRWISTSSITSSLAGRNAILLAADSIPSEMRACWGDGKPHRRSPK